MISKLEKIEYLCENTSFKMKSIKNVTSMIHKNA